MKKLLSFIIAASADAIISKVTGSHCSIVRDANRKTMNDWEVREKKRNEMKAKQEVQKAQKKKPINPALLSHNGNIQYGWNSNGDFVPVKIGEDNVSYGWNSNGDFVPVKIGEDNVSYGWNSNGDFVAKKVGDKDISYNWNSNGDFVAKKVGDKDISYSWNSNGDFVPKSIDK